MRDYTRGFRILTPDEITTMPYWKRLCFEYMGWNYSFDPESIDEWAEVYSGFGISSNIVNYIKRLVAIHE